MSTDNSFEDTSADIVSASDNPDEYSSLLQRRRPSHTFLDNPIGSFRGVNSLHNFASSFTRAQSFAASKIDNDIHRKRSFFFSNNDGSAPAATTSSHLNDVEARDELFDPELMVPSPRGERLSTVLHDLSTRNRNQLFANYDDPQSLSQLHSPHNDVFYQDDIISALTASRSRRASSHTTSGQGIPIPTSKRRLFTRPSMSSIRTTISSVTTASHINLKKIEDKDGNVITVLQGQSTAPQTIFNSINVLIGVGLLALPVGLLKAGWIIGLPLLALCGLVTFWTATLLSRAMDTDSTIMTYADLGYAAYGSMAKLVISLLFSVDLIGAGVALIVLFSDSLFALLGDESVDGTWLTKTNLKILSFFVLTPFTFLPLPILSIFSLLGIVCTISITMLVLICGLLKPDSPGSLLNIMPTNLWPQSTPDLLLAIGICMAPFGGHAIFPNLKSDMRHPYKFTRTLIPTYIITLLTDCSMGVLGFLMFGYHCNNEITNNLLITPGYPSWCYPLISGLICMIPLAKTPLNAKPIISTLDVLLGVDEAKTLDPDFEEEAIQQPYFDDVDEEFAPIPIQSSSTKSSFSLLKVFKASIRFLIRIGVNALFVALAIVFPEFDRIIGVLGASICFLICVILPGLFYLRLCHTKIGILERFLVSSAILVAAVLSITGTWANLTF